MRLSGEDGEAGEADDADHRTGTSAPDAVKRDAIAPDAVLDVRGLRCPLPVIRLATLVRDDPGVRTVRVLATDPATAYDLPAWCRLRGHLFVGSTTLAEHAEYDVEVRPSEPVAVR